MNSELSALDAHLSSLGFMHKSYNELSKNRVGSSLVNDATCEAYDFDEITSKLYSHFPHSVDALLLKEDLYFIEFKRIINVAKESKQKILKQNIQLKLSESMTTFYIEFANKLGLDVTKFKRIAIIVVDSNKSPISAMAGVMSGLSGGDSWLSDNNFIYHSVADSSGMHVYYNCVWIWNDLNFSANICSLR